MDTPIFSHDDLRYLKTLGISEEQVKSQVEIFKNTISHLNIDRPCTLGDGIRSVSKEEIPELVAHHKEAADKGSILKFVPASGAASRMFKGLLQFKKPEQEIQREEIARKAGEGKKQAQDFLSFIDGIEKFAFFNDLESVLASFGLDIDTQISEGHFSEILDYLLQPQGLSYETLPKGLIKFHQYPEGSRTAFEEHLVEATDYVMDAKGRCRLHFTVSPEHKQKFQDFLEEIRPQYEKRYQAQFQVEFSPQKRSTDTIAVDMKNQPFRDRDGRLLFRPGGHGTLIQNLEHIQGDILCIKNIDNVVPDRLKAQTSFWKKILVGYLMKTQQKTFIYAEGLASGKEEKGFLEDALDFARDSLCLIVPHNWQKRSLKEKREFLLKKLNRPLRICAVVENEGEPGGGPFWVKEKDGDLSLQIVEGAQVDPDSKDQQERWASATHFNPVDIVCGVRDYKRNPFHLEKYVNRNAVFISIKSKDGRDLKALEHPGLWNGAMAHWITIFIEVPIVTFNPVKTINDLLRKEHQTQ